MSDLNNSFENTYNIKETGAQYQNKVYNYKILGQIDQEINTILL